MGRDILQTYCGSGTRQRTKLSAKLTRELSLRYATRREQQVMTQRESVLSFGVRLTDMTSD